MHITFKGRQLPKKSFILEYLIVFFVIMSTDTVSLPIRNENLITIFIAIVAITGFLQYLLKNQWIVRKEIFIFIVLTCICCLLSQITNQDYSFAYELKIVLILLGFLVAKRIKFEKFRDIYINIMCFIAIISIVVFIMVKLDMTWWNILLLTSNGEYYSLIFSVIPVDLAHRARLFGPFWEPGVYQCYLNMAILFIVLDKVDIKKVIKGVVLISAVLLTFSTTGYICLFLVFLVFINVRGWHINMWQLGIGASAILFMFFVMRNEYIQWVVFEKFQSTSVGNSSFVIRLKDIQFYFYEWLKNPLLGTGVMPSYNSVVSQYVASGYNYAGSTSTTMREFAGLGGIVGTLKLVLQYRFSKKISPNIVCMCLIFLLFLIMLNTEDFIYSMFFNTIFFYGLGSIKIANNSGV